MGLFNHKNDDDQTSGQDGLADLGIPTDDSTDVDPSSDDDSTKLPDYAAEYFSDKSGDHEAAETREIPVQAIPLPATDDIKTAPMTFIWDDPASINAASPIDQWETRIFGSPDSVIPSELSGIENSWSSSDEPELVTDSNGTNELTEEQDTDSTQQSTDTPDDHESEGETDDKPAESESHGQPNAELSSSISREIVQGMRLMISEMLPGLIAEGVQQAYDQLEPRFVDTVMNINQMKDRARQRKNSEVLYRERKHVIKVYIDQIPPVLVMLGITAVYALLSPNWLAITVAVVLLVALMIFYAVVAANKLTNIGDPEPDTGPQELDEQHSRRFSLSNFRSNPWTAFKLVFGGLGAIVLVAMVSFGYDLWFTIVYGVLMLLGLYWMAFMRFLLTTEYKVVGGRITAYRPANWFYWFRPELFLRLSLHNINQSSTRLTGYWGGRLGFYRVTSNTDADAPKQDEHMSDEEYEELMDSYRFFTDMTFMPKGKELAEILPQS